MCLCVCVCVCVCAGACVCVCVLVCLRTSSVGVRVVPSFLFYKCCSSSSSSPLVYVFDVEVAMLCDQGRAERASQFRATVAVPAMSVPSNGVLETVPCTFSCRHVVLTYRHRVLPCPALIVPTALCVTAPPSVSLYCRLHVAVAVFCDCGLVSMLMHRCC